jgi:spore germination protein GerM
VRRLLGALAVVVLAFATCSRGSEVELLSPKSLPDELYNPGAQTAGSPRVARASLYFVRTDTNGRLLTPARLGVVTRVERTDRPAAEFAMRQLLRGPNPDEQSRLRTALPIGTELLGVTTRNRIAIVNLSAQFEAAGAEVLHLLRIAQVVWTLTDLPSVDAVQFRIHGAPQPVIDQNGVAHDLVGQARYSRFAPIEEEGTETPRVGGDVAPDAS